MTPRLTAALTAAFCIAATVAAEPDNLGLLKIRVLEYLESEEFINDADAVAKEAVDWISERSSRRAEGERLVVILDIDETALSNLPHLVAMNFGFVNSLWDDWVMTAKGPAIAPVLKIYKAARKNGVSVVFISGRREGVRPGTIKNLIDEGYAEFEALLLKEDFSTEPTSAFKARERERLTREGWTIISSVGDQESDFAGGFAERTFKMPNPAYFIN